MSPTLSPELMQLVEEKMADGEYSTQDELLRTALHALDELEARHAQLRDEIQQRLQRAGTGVAKPLDLPKFKAEARARLST